MKTFMEKRDMFENFNNTIKVYYTSDTHAHVVPNFLNVINNFKKEENTLIIDGGDTIQGSPLSMYLSNIKDASVFSKILNLAQYDYVTLGNHEFNYGKQYLDSFLGSLKAKLLCANISGFKAYDIKNVLGIKVGIVGLTTDFIPMWEREEHLEGLTFTDPFFCAKSILEEIKEKCDLTILIYHGGYEKDVFTGEVYSETKENVGYKICDELEYDLVLTAHQHKPMEGAYINGTYTVQPPHNATSYIEIHIVFENGKPKFKSFLKTPEINLEENPINIPDFLKEHIKNKDKLLNEQIGKLKAPLVQGDYLHMALNGSELANFQNMVQLWATKANHSSTGLPNKTSGLNEIVTLRDVFSTFIYPNNLIVLEMTYDIIKEVLERTAAYFHYEDNVISVEKSFLKPKIAHYDYDYYTFKYTIDITKPIGNRVISIDVPEKFTLCLTNYRAGGSGGYTSYKKAKVVKEYTQYINELIIEYFKSHEIIEVQKFPNVEVLK